MNSMTLVVKNGGSCSDSAREILSVSQLIINFFYTISVHVHRVR